MLSLSRKAGESIHIGDAIEITISKIRGNHVRVSIKAPEDLPVYRDKVYQRIKAEQSTVA